MLAMSPVNPAGAKNQVVAPSLSNGRFPGGLRFSVYAQRMDGVAFHIGAGLGSVKDIVGRVMDEKSVQPRRLLCQHSGSGGVDGEAKGTFFFGLVDSRVGTGV